MCGIFVCGVKNSKEEPSKALRDELLLLLHNRGPDGYTDYSVNILDWKIEFVGSVLWMQGRQPLQQPAKDEKGNVLLWNGDIFDGPWVPGDGKSDTCVVLENVFGNNSSTDNILKSISAIKGPYSFVYWCESTKKLWFGRDRIGRHSLLSHFQEHGQFLLTSVGKRSVPLLEVPVVGIFVMDFSEDLSSVILYPWSDVSEKELLSVKNWPIPINVSESIVDSPISTKCPVPHEPTMEYCQLIHEACHSTTSIFDKLLSNDRILIRVEQLLDCLRKAVKLRSKTQPGICKNCLFSIIEDSSFDTNDIQCSHPKVGILFSGGLDSTILAALLHESIPLDDPIDLFNVAFENYSKNNLQSGLLFTTPDRTTGYQSSEELQAIFPSRLWNFIEINVSREELNHFRRKRIGDLIHPLMSILDDGLGCALWFASRLSGILRETEYSSPARVLFLGMGADEQFGGYTRHRTTLRREGWSALAEEIEMELQRIASRNLGRDDRIVADHGRQARFPFLDEDLINFVSTLPIWERCHPTSELPPGIGDKLLLRLVAWKIGLKKAALYPKRALQFGSRIADGKEKGSDISSRLLLQ